jgi:hypothetical protein
MPAAAAAELFPAQGFSGAALAAPFAFMAGVCALL